jgi:hypothetical protein
VRVLRLLRLSVSQQLIAVTLLLIHVARRSWRRRCGQTRRWSPAHWMLALVVSSAVPQDILNRMDRRIAVRTIPRLI